MRKKAVNIQWHPKEYDRRFGEPIKKEKNEALTKKMIHDLNKILRELIG